MLCQHCKKNEANVNYVEVINGESFELHLCSSCYAEMYGGLNSKSAGEIWPGLFGDVRHEKKVCPVCGLSYSDYERTGLLGCASCYDVFKEELIPSIRRIQGKVNHVGKTADNRDEFGLHRRLNELKGKLEVALREKRYADAGRLNAEINEIKKIIYGGGNE